MTIAEQPAFPTGPLDIRLIAVDMDGTLLDERGEVPDSLWPLLVELEERGIFFAPASGRQYATLRRTFGTAGDDMVFIAENGTFVAQHDRELSSDILDPEFVRAVVSRLRALAASEDIGVVVCGKASAYIERTDAAFRVEAERYYAQLTMVDDILAHGDAVLKLAVYALGSSAPVSDELDDVRATHQVVVSGEHWVDVMNQGIDKGEALQRLQRELGVDRSQTVAFGDYLNDLELLDAADLSFAMANAHPEVLARARFRAPSHVDEGVITTIRRLLEGRMEG